MCRKTLFISMVVLAAVSVSLAQNQSGCAQFSCFGGGGITYAFQGGSLGSDVDTNFSTGQSSDSLVCGSCNGTNLYQSNNNFIDQGSAAGGCGGLSGANTFIVGGGIQGQSSGHVQSPYSPTCYPYSVQGQSVGATSGLGVFATCGTNGAAAGQAGAASEYQSIQTPSSGGSQYQYLSGSQAGQVTGSPTSFASAGGFMSGGAYQGQSFGGLPPI